MKYILDFDRTLFDTESFYVEADRINQSEHTFTPRIWESINACGLLYDDVLDWLATKDKNDLYILTAISPKYGSESSDYQKGKLVCSKVNELVADVVFMQGLKAESAMEIAKRFPSDETIVFVDDTLEQCVSVKEVLPNAICCLMVRDKSVIEDVEIPQDIKVVHCLSDVDDIIKNA